MLLKLVVAVLSNGLLRIVSIDQFHSLKRNLRGTDVRVNRGSGVPIYLIKETFKIIV